MIWADNDATLIYEQELEKITAVGQKYEITISIIEHDKDGFSYETDYDTYVNFSEELSVEEVLELIGAENVEALENKENRYKVYDFLARMEIEK